MPYDRYPFELPELKYAYNAYEPAIDAETMHYHHDKHFQTYIDNLNKAIEPYPKIHEIPLNVLLTHSRLMPAQARTAIERNGGGVFNHNLWFQTLMPPSKENHPRGRLGMAIDDAFGSYEIFKREFTEHAKEVFGSGWTFLVKTSRERLKIINLHNQETPLPQGHKPIFTFDIWEHAYYLRYKNARAEYIDNLWSVIDFSAVEL